MTETERLIRYYRGTVIASSQGVYLAHYGNADVLWYGIGCMLREPESWKTEPLFRIFDVPNFITQEKIDALTAHPETISAFIVPEKMHPPREILPLDQENLPLLLETVRSRNPQWQWEGYAKLPDFLIVRRMHRIISDRWAVVTSEEPSSPFTGGPPLWDETVTKEQVDAFARNPAAMLRWYEGMRAAQEARRQQYLQEREQYRLEHPELFREPRKKRRHKKSPNAKHQ